MPITYEASTSYEVLCHIPSGKIDYSSDLSLNQKRLPQLAQDGGTCWYFAVKRLAQADELTINDLVLQQRYRIISNSRKESGRFYGLVEIAKIIIQNCNGSEENNNINEKCRMFLTYQMELINKYRENPNSFGIENNYKIMPR